jgi:GxxExxY protein
MDKDKYNYISGQILDAAYHVHKEMGPGLLESVYQYCLADELKFRELYIMEQFLVPLFYKGKNLNKNFLVDILVEQEIIIEIKAVEVILPVHEAQIISYLKLTNKKLGILINFNVSLIKNGFKRIVNNF